MRSRLNRIFAVTRHANTVGLFRTRFFRMLRELCRLRMCLLIPLQVLAVVLALFLADELAAIVPRIWLFEDWKGSRVKAEAAAAFLLAKKRTGEHFRTQSGP